MAHTEAINVLKGAVNERTKRIVSLEKQITDLVLEVQDLQCLNNEVLDSIKKLGEEDVRSHGC